MSEKNSEELMKRICLICGCHTNQTINIYEPRSGPNIVQLIQAKFKFQPVNEDKHLCFSCNNWLINWHSLQSVNSNESESQSGKFRCQLNGSIPEEELKMEFVAQVKPQARVAPMPRQPATTSPVAVVAPAAAASTTTTIPHNKRNAFCFSKRGSIRSRKVRRKPSRPCRMCGRLLLTNATPASIVQHFNSSTKSRRCRICRRILHWRAQYLKSMVAKEKNTSLLQHATTPRANKPSRLVNEIQIATQAPKPYQRPLIDGKVVSMLRRVGTTLSREGPTATSSTTLPQIMSPSKKTKSLPVWRQQQRPIDDNEILIDFNTAITEVLPRKLYFQSYQVSSTSSESEVETETIEIDESDEEDEGDDVQLIDLEEIYCKIPKGLTVSLSTNSY